MVADLHFLRPLWLLCFIPFAVIGLILWFKKPRLQAWKDICDSHLLSHLKQNNAASSFRPFLLCLLLSVFFVLLSLAGPSWDRLPMPLYQPAQPRVIVLDLSDSMLETTPKPNRLERAKFILTDLLNSKIQGQWGLVVYTSEPFVASPITEDGQTIKALFPMLNPDIMPVQGQHLDAALDQAALLIQQAGFQDGKILVLTPSPPSKSALQRAKKLSEKNIFSSIVPLTTETPLDPAFEQFASEGGGRLLLYTSNAKIWQSWLVNRFLNSRFTVSHNNNIPLWRDEGRWFLLPALFFLLPFFRRGWWQRLAL